MSKEFVYVLSPVRQVTEDQAAKIAEHVDSLRREGVRVFNPVEDAPQDDATGYNIVMAELDFMREASKNGGRVDILWNAGGKPSEGSRVDVGIAMALGLPVKLVTVFNENDPTGPQDTFKIVKQMNSTEENGDSILLFELADLISEIKETNFCIIDWNVEMKGRVEEWQRIKLGLALGLMAENPGFKIKLGKLEGIDPPGKKSYPKVIREIEKRQAGRIS